MDRNLTPQDSKLTNKGRSIEVVMRSPSTKHVLEFDTFLELAQYVVKQQGKE